MSEESDLAGLLAQARVPTHLLAALANYGAMLLEANRRFNLTGASSPAELAPHILDSLSIQPYVREPIVDVGSGGGLPGIPIAIATGFRVTLVEPSAKKSAFLARALADLALPGRVVAERAEVAGRMPRFREMFESATCRAVSNASTVVELTLPFLRIGGFAVLQRGNLQPGERNAARDAASMLGGADVQEFEVSARRRLLCVRKVSDTPARFPRRTGIPEKRPLRLECSTWNGEK